MKKTLKKSSKMPESVKKRLKGEKLLSMKYPTSGFNTKVRRDRIINNLHLYTSKKSISKSALPSSTTNTGESKHGGRRRKKNRRKSRRKSKKSKRKSRRKSRGKKR